MAREAKVGLGVCRAELLRDNEMMRFHGGNVGDMLDALTAEICFCLWPTDSD